MSSERPEFKPIEIAPARRVWPYAVLGAVVAAALLFVARRNYAAAQTQAAPAQQPQTAVLASVAPRTEPRLEPLVQQPKVAEGPNVIGNAVAAAGKLAMVARSELDRELGRSRAAQKQAEGYRKQIEGLQKELMQARAQLAAWQKVQQPPPPSDQEQILQMLAPVLRTSNDGRP